MKALSAIGRALARAAPIVLRASPILALCAAWEIFARSGAVTPFMLPPLSDVLVRIYDDAAGGDLFLNTGVTLYRALAGFFIAVAAGLALGMAMSRNALARSVCR